MKIFSFEHRNSSCEETYENELIDFLSFQFIICFIIYKAIKYLILLLLLL